MQGNGIFAPKDMRRGGSWIGVNRSGLFVGLTNRADIKSERGKTSRGEIVMKALACKTLKEVEKYISGLDTTELLLRDLLDSLSESVSVQVQQCSRQRRTEIQIGLLMESILFTIVLIAFRIRRPHSLSE